MSASPPIVGRDAELVLADRLLESTRGGSRGALLVLGEAGIGKTRLLTEVASRAQATGCTVMTGRAVSGGGTYRALAEAVLGFVRDGTYVDAEELRPFRTALSTLSPGWQGVEGADGQAGADPVLVLGEGLVRLLRLAARGGACLLVLEDLHWADADTVGTT